MLSLPPALRAYFSLLACFSLSFDLFIVCLFFWPPQLFPSPARVKHHKLSSCFTLYCLCFPFIPASLPVLLISVVLPLFNEPFIYMSTYTNTSVAALLAWHFSCRIVSPFVTPAVIVVFSPSGYFLAFHVQSTLTAVSQVSVTKCVVLLWNVDEIIWQSSREDVFYKMCKSQRRGEDLRRETSTWRRHISKLPIWSMRTSIWCNYNKELLGLLF